MACKKCNSCEDNGCAPVVYPKCILTEAAYSCIGTAAGVTGTVLLSAINTKFCGIAASISAINTSIVSIQNDITALDESISSIQNSITTIENNITAIGNDITAIEEDIVTINNALTALAPETWKTIGAGGTFSNGQSVPGLNTGAQVGGGVQLFQVRKNTTYVDMRGSIDITVDADNPLNLITTLPTGYRPASIQTVVLWCTEISASARYPVDVQITTSGQLIIAPTTLVIPGFYNLRIDLYFSFDTL